jgi:hypothetical protein
MSTSDTSTVRSRVKWWWRVTEGEELANDGAKLSQRLLPLIPPILASVLVAIGARAEIGEVRNVNDTAAHKFWVSWALERIRAGKTPFDGWISNLSFGVPHFHYYQSRPHVIVAAIEYLTGIDAYGWSTVVLLALFPLSIYTSFNRLGWGRWAASTAGAAALLMSSADGHGLEIQSYVWSGRGVWTQLWASIFLPWAIILGWRAVRSGKGYLGAVVAISVTMWFHLIQAWFLLILFPVWLLVTPHRIGKRVGRVAFLGAASLCAAAWTLAPTILDQAFVGQTEFNEGTPFKQSYGGGQVTKWFFTGHILDSKALEAGWHNPMLTIVALIGLATMLWYGPTRIRLWILRRVAHRTGGVFPPSFDELDESTLERDETFRVAGLVTLVGTLLFFGPAFWGHVLEIIPGGSALIFHRFVLASQIGMLMLVAGGAYGIRSGLSWAGRYRDADPMPLLGSLLAIGSIALMCFPGTMTMRDYLRQNAEWIALQQANDDITDPNSDGAAVKKLLEVANERGPGRVYAGSLTDKTWGPNNRVYQSPLFMWMLSEGVDEIGFNIRTQSLTTDIEPRFNDKNRAQFELFNVRYWLSDPNVAEPSAALGAQQIARSGRFRLWEIATAGYLDAIDLNGDTIVTEKLWMGRDSKEFIDGANLASKAFPLMDIGQGVDSSLKATTTGETLQAEWKSQSPSLLDGEFSGVVDLNRDAFVMLKQSYHPGWRVTVDEIERDPIMVAPGFIAVAVPKGEHRVEFRYEPIGYLLPLWILAVGAYMVAADAYRLRSRAGEAIAVRLRPLVSNTESKK